MTFSEVTLRGKTALHLVVKNSQFQALQVLLEGLNDNHLLEILNSEDEEGNTILYLAAARRNRRFLFSA